MRQDAAARSALIAVLACAWLAAPALVAAQSPPAGTLSLSAGVFRPSDESFRRVYGAAKVPFTAQLDWRLAPRVALFVGVQHLRASGTPVADDTGVPVSAGATDESIEARLRLTSFRAGGLVLFPSGRWLVSAGAGLIVTRYSERWAAAGANVSGSRAGWLAQAKLARSMGSRFLVEAAFEYTYARVDQREDPDLVPRLGLGGVSFAVGGGIRF